VFVMVGWVPNSDILRGLVKLDERGYVIANQFMETSAPGIFVAGDVHDYIYRQAITAAGEGAAAAISAEKYLAERGS
jgi:thioredoxin reductase (NADPH)